MSMLTQEQKDQIDEAIAYMVGASNVLELHELRLRKFDDVKADPSDPYCIDMADATDAISLAREKLDDAIDLLHAFDNTKVEEEE